MLSQRIVATLLTLFVALAGERLFAQATEPGTAQVQGEVTNENSAPLADALVRVAVPAVDMRDVYPGSGHTTFEGRTDTQGRYSIEVRLPGPTSCSVDAMKPGFRTGAGSFMLGGDKRTGKIKPGDAFEASFILPPSFYVAGTSPISI